MIISEKQINELIAIAHLHIRTLETMSLVNESLLTDCGQHNKIYVANLLMTICAQQSKCLKVIE